MPGRSTKTRALAFRLPVVVYEALAEDARCSGVTPASFVRDLLSRYTAHGRAQNDRERLQALAGELGAVRERIPAREAFSALAAQELAKDVDQALGLAIDEIGAYDPGKYDGVAS